MRGPGLQSESGTLPAFVNKVLGGHRRASVFACYLWLFALYHTVASEAAGCPRPTAFTLSSFNEKTAGPSSSLLKSRFMSSHAVVPLAWCQVRATWCLFSACEFVMTLVQGWSRHLEDEDVHTAVAGCQVSCLASQRVSPVLSVVRCSRQEQQGILGRSGREDVFEFHAGVGNPVFFNRQARSGSEGLKSSELGPACNRSTVHP